MATFELLKSKKYGGWWLYSRFLNLRREDIRAKQNFYTDQAL